MDVDQNDQEAVKALLEVAGPKRSSKGLYLALYYGTIVAGLAIIGIGTFVALVTGYAGRANWPVGVFYFGAAVLLVCLALYFKTKAQ